MKFNVYLVAGLALVLFGLLSPYIMAVYVADDTPPEILNKVPNGLGEHYSVNVISTLRATVRDLQSGILGVYCIIDSANYVLAKAQAYDDGSELWSKTVSGGPLTPGTHGVTWKVTNNVGLETEVKGTYNIYVDLTGKWYINNVEVTSSTQEIKSQSLTANFKFSKTSIGADTLVHCYIYEGTVKLLELEYVTAATWTGSYTFTAGRHILQLKATDGVANVVMETVSFGDSPIMLPNWLTASNIMLVCGICLTGYGLYTQKRLAK